MNTTEFAFAMAGRLASVVRRAEMFGPKTREEILEEIMEISIELNKYARRVEEVELLAKQKA